MNFLLNVMIAGSIGFTRVHCADPPVVAPFAFPPALKERERGSAACTIRSGDRPLTFQWQKDGQDLQETSEVEIQSMKDTSFLVIESVTSKSSGNYTCIVTNSHGKDQFTGSLTVTAPPEWIKEPLDTVSKEGDLLTIDCLASGVPHPTVKWISGDQKVFISGEQSGVVYTSSSGSLVLSKVDASMQGRYTCEADNGFGAPLRKEISISVRGE